MQENGLGVSKAAVDDYCIDFSDLDTQGEMGNSSKGEFAQNSDQPVVKPNGVLNFEVTPETKGTVVSDEASRNYDSVKVGSVVSSGDCVSVMVNLEPKESLSSEGKYDSVAEKEGRGEGQSSLGEVKENDAKTVLAVVISSRAGGNQSGAVTDTRGSMMSKGDALNCDSVPVVLDSKEICVKIADTKGNQCVGAVSSAKKGTLSRSESFDEQCRVCQQSSEETLIDLGCQCRGGLAKAHRSCIDTWFRTRGSNKCEICQQVATNVSPPEYQRNYWVWRIDPTFRGPGMAPERERACYSPLWVAFSILIGGLLLDVLISISLGVSALPVNIIIGVLVVLGLGTALRLALECCHELSLRRAVQRAETNITLGPLGYHPAV